MEAHHRAAFLGDVARAQARPAAVVPSSPYTIGSRISGCTLPMRARFSSSPRCLAAICVRASTCCRLQPPHTPKWGQRGIWRLEEPPTTLVRRPISNEVFLRRTWKSISSPGNAPSTKITLPSGLRATPRPSASSDSMRTVTPSRATGTPASGPRCACRACRAGGRAPIRSALGCRCSASAESAGRGDRC